MNELTYDPSEYIRGLQQLLVSGKKKIAFLFGAGTSLAKKRRFLSLEDKKERTILDWSAVIL